MALPNLCLWVRASPLVMMLCKSPPPPPHADRPSFPTNRKRFAADYGPPLAVDSNRSAVFEPVHDSNVLVRRYQL